MYERPTDKQEEDAGALIRQEIRHCPCIGQPFRDRSELSGRYRQKSCCSRCNAIHFRRWPLRPAEGFRIHRNASCSPGVSVYSGQRRKISRRSKRNGKWPAGLSLSTTLIDNRGRANTRRKTRYRPRASGAHQAALGSWRHRTAAGMWRSGRKRRTANRPLYGCCY